MLHASNWLIGDRQNQLVPSESLLLPLVTLLGKSWLKPIPLGEGIYDPLGVFKITPKRLSQRHWNFVSFSSYLTDTFKKIPVNGITTLFDDVITKTDGANFTVKSLLNSKIDLMITKSHLSKMFSWNFHRILSIRLWVHYKRNKIFSSRSFLRYF